MDYILLCIATLLLSITYFIISNNKIVVSTSPKVCVVSLIRKPVDISIWLNKLRKIGVMHFFLRIEDTDELKEFLKVQNDVTFVMEKSSKGNNYESLQKRQVNFVNKTMRTAILYGFDWVFHIDSDELLGGSLKFLETLDAKYMCLKLNNVEAIYEENQETCFSSTQFIKCNMNGATCRSYINGKGGGRLTNGVKLAGPHDFSYNEIIDGKATYNVPFEDLHILHFDSCTFGAWIDKFHHLGKDSKITPFAYYNDSINEVKQAYNLYKKYTMNIPTNKEYIYTIE